MDEVRLAFRRLTKRPGATLASIVTLACAIGAAAATSSLISSVLLHPLPVDVPSRLVVVGERIVSGHDAGSLRNSHVYPLYAHVRDSGIFEGVAAGGSSKLLVSAGALPEEATVYFASANFFDVLGVRIQVGRDFRSDDDRRGAPLVAVLSDRYWRRAFGAEPGVLGRVLTIASKPVTVVGIAPHGFRGLDLADAPEVYLPLNSVADVASPMTNFFGEANHPSSPTAWVTIIGRVSADSTVTRAAARIAHLSSSPGLRGSHQYGLTNVNAAAVPPVSRVRMLQFTGLLGVTVGLLLLIGCATVGLLLLVRTEARREEFAMCLALGASRPRLARGVAIEGAILALAGAALALPITTWLFVGVRGFHLPGGVDVDLLNLTVDVRVLTVAAGCAVAGTLLIAVVAGAFGFSADIGDALRSHAGATPSVTRRRMRALLLTGQVAVALVLITGTGLFARSLMAALSLNPRFDTTRIVSGDVSLQSYGYTPVRATAFFEDLVGRLSTHPAIRGASMTGSPGGLTSFAGRLVIDGEPRELPSSLAFMSVDQRYFDTIGVRVLRGREFSADDTEGAALVGIASESFGRLIARGERPTGHRITLPVYRPPAPRPVIEIVGVVPDLITNVSTPEPLVLYVPLAQQPPSTSRTIVLRAATDAVAARREAVSAIRQIDATVTPGPILTIDERIGRQMSAQRFGVTVLGALGAIALLLTLLGTYVLAESMAVTRMREMGIRAALGASSRQLAAIMLMETSRLIGLGLLTGGMLASMSAGLIRAFLFRVQPLDPVTLAGVSAIILLLALTVSLRPALRAASVDLNRVLKEE